MPMPPDQTTATSPSNRRWRNLPRNVWVTTIGSLLTDISSEMVLNLLPLFLANVLGARTNVIGLIEGLAETTASVLKLVSGWLSDRLGRRKWLTVGGYSLSTLAKPFLYLATAWSGVLVVRFADRIGKGIRTAPRDALLADSIEPSQRGLAFGLHRAGDTLGAAIGIGAALLLVWLTQGRSLTLSRASFQTIVLWSIVPALLAVLILAVGLRETGQRAAQPVPFPRLSAAGFDRRFRRFLVIIGLFTLGNSADAFIILRGQERGLSVLGILGMLLTFSIVYSLTSGPAGALSDRIGRRQFIVGGWLIYSLIYMGLALARSAWHIWALYAAYGLYYGLVEGNAKALVADLVAPTQRGVAYGLYNAVVGLAALPASLIAGLVWQGVGSWPGFGPAAPFVVGAGLALLAAFLFIMWLDRPLPA